MRNRLLTALVGGILLLGGSAPTALAADRKPPKIKTTVKAAFVVGDVIGPSNLLDSEGENNYTSEVQFRLKWKMRDKSRSLCGSTVVFDYGDDPSNNPIVGEWNQKTRSPRSLRFVDELGWVDYTGSLGGGGTQGTGWFVSARDCTGNATTVRVAGAHIDVRQENNRSAHGDWWPSTGVLTYSGPWSQVSCLCASGGEMTQTSVKDASFTYTQSYLRGDHVALVMAKGPGRGKAALLFDGSRVKTIDTYAPVNTNRVVVFQKAMPAGVHTIQVVNLATPGRPRIDLDAVLNN